MCKTTHQLYAMKVMRKDKIVQNDHSEYVKAERDVLTSVHHPYIVTLRFSFQVFFFYQVLQCYKLSLLHFCCGHKTSRVICNFRALVCKARSSFMKMVFPDFRRFSFSFQTSFSL